MKNIAEVQLAVAKIIGRNEFNTNDRIEKLADIMELIKEQLTLTDVSQRSELLPEFLMKDLDGKIITSVIGSSDVTKEWNDYLGNCD